MKNSVFKGSLIVIILLGLAASFAFYNYAGTTSKAIKKYSKFNDINLTIVREIDLRDGKVLSVDKDEDGLYYVNILGKKKLTGWNVLLGGSGKNLTDIKGSYSMPVGGSVYWPGHKEYANLVYGYLVDGDYSGLSIDDVSYNVEKIDDKSYIYYSEDDNIMNHDCDFKIKVK